MKSPAKFQRTIKSLILQSFCLMQSHFSKPFLQVFIYLMLISGWSLAQIEDSVLSSNKLKKLTLEELMNIEVTSVSGAPEKLTEVASAIQIITPEDMRRSGIVRLPEALRLASNLQIAQANSHDWSITSRGFSGLPTAGGLLSNKLLALIDGRSIYSPLFGGIYWDVQNTVLEDVDLIEIVSGPGGVLWGANAVNGVINIKTKSADNTQGLYVSQIAGVSSFAQDHTVMRYGGKIGENLYYRIYGQHFEMKRETTSDTVNRQIMKQGGFRMDYYPSSNNTLTFQGDFYNGDENNLTRRVLVAGQNALSRFTHTFSEKSNLVIKLYADHTSRKPPTPSSALHYEVFTYDMDIQYHFPIGERQVILMGGEYRYMQDKTNVTALNPQNRIMPLESAFIQDDIAIAKDLLKLTIGNKFLNNVFTGFEIHPTARIAFTPNKNNTIWAAVSRAVRMPSRFDADLVSSTGASFAPMGFESEKVNAYELGYRLKPMENVFFSFATFYNHYTDLRSLNASTDTTMPIIFANGQKAKSWGLEFFSNYQATQWWRMRIGYTFFRKDISTTSSSVIPLSAEFEGVDPENQFSIQSIMDLPKDFDLDITGRYVDVLKSAPPIPSTPAYYSLDIRIAKQFNHLEVSLAGQHLLEKEHFETGNYSIPRSIYGKVICRF
jgi:iron complex outermembrane receptor protein